MTDRDDVPTVPMPAVVLPAETLQNVRSPFCDDPRVVAEVAGYLEAALGRVEAVAASGR